MAGMTTQGGALVSEASCQLPALAVRRMLRQHDCSQTRWRRVVVVKVRERQSRTSRTSRQDGARCSPPGRASENLASSWRLPGVKQGLAECCAPFLYATHPGCETRPYCATTLNLTLTLTQRP